jgi:hypothetical protein
MAPWRKHVEVKEFDVDWQDAALYGQIPHIRRAGYPMNASQAATPLGNKAGPADENKPGFRTKTIATRLTPDELAEIETAAEGAGQALSEWLRETALNASRQRSSNSVELLLAEVWAVRYALLNLFHAGAQATAEGKALAPESVVQIRNEADARKLTQARKLIEDFAFFKVKNRGIQ